MQLKSMSRQVRLNSTRSSAFWLQQVYIDEGAFLEQLASPGGSAFPLPALNDGAGSSLEPTDARKAIM